MNIRALCLNIVMTIGALCPLSAFAGSVPNPVNAPVGGIASGHIYCAGSNLQQSTDCGALSGLATLGANTFTGTQTAPNFVSTISTGTAPFTVSSTTVVPNLNVSQLLGGTWASPGAIGTTTPNTGAFTTLNTSGATTLGSGFANPVIFGNGSVSSGVGNLNLTFPSTKGIIVTDQTLGTVLTIGLGAATVTGRLNMLAGTANNPFSFTAAGSTFADTGFAFALPTSASQFNFFLPNMSGSYSPLGSNTFNCGGVKGAVTICNNTDTMAAAGGNAPTSFRVVRQTGGTGATGGRFAIAGYVLITANTSDVTNSFWQATDFHAEAAGNAGGTSGNELGSLFATGGLARLKSGATHWLEASVGEADIAVENGASVAKLHGWSVTLLDVNTQTPSLESTAFALSGQYGATPTIQCGLCFGRFDGVNALASNAAFIGIHPQAYTGAGPSIAFGDDYRLGTFSGAVFAGPNGDILNNGSLRVGRGHITSSGAGFTLDPTGSIGVSATVAAGGSSYTATPGNFDDGYGGIWQIAVTAGAVSGVTMLRAPHTLSAPPANPIALLPPNGQVGTGATINITWSTGTGVTIAGDVTLSTLATGVAATYACFTAGGQIISSAAPC